MDHLSDDAGDLVVGHAAAGPPLLDHPGQLLELLVAVVPPSEPVERVADPVDVDLPTGGGRFEHEVAQHTVDPFEHLVSLVAIVEQAKDRLPGAACIGEHQLGEEGAQFDERGQRLFLELVRGGGETEVERHEPSHLDLVVRIRRRGCVAARGVRRREQEGETIRQVGRSHALSFRNRSLGERCPERLPACWRV